MYGPLHEAPGCCAGRGDGRICAHMSSYGAHRSLRRLMAGLVGLVRKLRVALYVAVAAVYGLAGGLVLVFGVRRTVR